MLRDSDSESVSDVCGKEVCSGASEELVAGKSVAKDVFVDVKKISLDLHPSTGIYSDIESFHL